MSPQDILPPEMDGWTLTKDLKNYDRETIFDYINGAGEVYRSYAYQSVLVAGYSKPGSPGLIVEIFDMGLPEDAYGVFSYTRESEIPGIGMAYEYRGTLLCFWQNRYYICVLGEAPGPAVKEAVFKLASALAGRIPAAGVRPSLIELLPKKDLIPFSDRYFHLHPSLNYHYYLASDNILNLNPQTNAVLARYKPGKTHLLCIEYENEESAAAACESFVQNYIPETATQAQAEAATKTETGAQTVETEPGKFTGCRQVQNILIIVFDAGGAEGAGYLLDSMTKNLSQENEKGADS